jgi:four helix bundle protein
VLDAERLDCYRVAREMRALVVPLLATASRAVRDQLDRASLSVVLNTAEGAGRVAPRSKAQFYSIARGSANETAALLDVNRSETGDGNEQTVQAARGRAVRVVQMLVKLEQRFGPRGR